VSYAAPGWYPDHYDPTRERWWDGETWSPVTRASVAAPRRLGPVTPDGVPLSAPGWRLLARLLDSLVVTLLSLLPGFAAARALFAAMQEALPAAGSGGPVNPFSVYTNPAFVSAATDLSLIQLAVGAVYSIAFIGWRGATLGKLAVGIRVRSWGVEGRPSWNQAALRWLTSDGVGALPGVGLLWSLLDSLWLLWDPHRQALHDKLPRTVVVRGR